jgi:hypothetical protein
VLEGSAPLGFGSAAQFGAACEGLCSALGESGITDALVGVRGSSVTGTAFGTGAPFSAASDIDFFVQSQQLVSQGLRTSSNIPGMVFPSAIENAFPSVTNWASKWSGILGRPVSVAGFPPGAPLGPVIMAPP